MANVITIALQDRVSAYLPGTGDTVIHQDCGFSRTSGDRPLGEF